MTETATELAARLAEERAVIDVKRTDELERRRLDVDHRNALADLDETSTSRRRARRERDRDETEGAELAALYRLAARSGTRARIRADIHRSAEMRALRVARVRQATLWVGVPVLVALGLWSTAGVQAGVVRTLDLDADTAYWWAAWVVEPALLAIVALIIVARAVLRSSGGDTDWQATAIEWAALTTSVALNMAGGWAGTGWQALAGALAHSVGPLGAAGVALLIGLFDGYVTQARPWDGAPRLVDLDLTAPAVTHPAAPAPLPTLDAPAALPVTHTPTPADAPVAHPDDAPVARPAPPASPQVAPALARYDAPQRRTRQVVMRRPVSAPPADRDAALKSAADAVLTQRVSIRGAARAADVPEATLRRHLDKLRADAQPAQKVNGYAHTKEN